MCRKSTDLQHQQRNTRGRHGASEVVIQAIGHDLEKASQFCCPGHILEAFNSDWLALYKNLKKAKLKWALTTRPLINTGVSNRIVGMFCMATVQAVPLCGSETWAVTPAMLQVLDSFHHQIARCITSKMPKRVHGQWQCPPLSKALQEAGLHAIATHIRRRQSTITQCIVSCPILQLCQDATPPAQQHSRIRWWTQPPRTDEEPKRTSTIPIPSHPPLQIFMTPPIAVWMPRQHPTQRHVSDESGCGTPDEFDEDAPSCHHLCPRSHPQHLLSLVHQRPQLSKPHGCQRPLSH